DCRVLLSRKLWDGALRGLIQYDAHERIKSGGRDGLMGRISNRLWLASADRQTTRSAPESGSEPQSTKATSNVPFVGPPLCGEEHVQRCWVPNTFGAESKTIASGTKFNRRAFLLARGVSVSDASKQCWRG